MAFRLISKSGASRVLSACLLLAQAIASPQQVIRSDGTASPVRLAMVRRSNG